MGMLARPLKQCDKGAGLVILNFQDYMKSAEEHLAETMESEEGIQKPYYKEVIEADFDKAKNNILSLLQSDYDNEIISKDEFEAMCPDSKTASKFYCNFKIHKPHNHIPPVRPIVNGSGSNFENPVIFKTHLIS